MEPAASRPSMVMQHNIRSTESHELPATSFWRSADTRHCRSAYVCLWRLCQVGICKSAEGPAFSSGGVEKVQSSGHSSVAIICNNADRMDSVHPRTRARWEAHPCEDPIAAGCLQFSLSGPTQWAWLPFARCCARLHPGKQIRHVRIRKRLVRLRLQACKLSKGAEGGALQVRGGGPSNIKHFSEIDDRNHYSGPKLSMPYSCPDCTINKRLRF